MTFLKNHPFTLGALFIVAYILVDIWCRFLASKKGIALFADVPNERSSHSKITPRGGGLPFSICLAMGLACAAILEIVPYHFLGFALPFLILSLVGLLDDLRGLSALSRLFIQASCAALFFAIFLFWQKDAFEGHRLQVLLSIGILWVFYTLSAINFFNFADGINGFVSTTSTLSIVIACFFLITANDAPSGWLWICALLALLGGLCAFIYHNLVKKSVFMGDCGSTVLGFLHGVLCLLAFVPLSEKIPSFSLMPTELSFLILIAAAISIASWIFVDCAAMVLAKLKIGMPLSKPHRMHLYQRISRNPHMTHFKTTVFICSMQLLSFGICLGLINLFGFYAGGIAVTAALICVTFFVAKSHIKALIQNNIS